ncbi:acyl-CoA-binding protein [Gongronella butleri]|nr:acyl-CoA-binding protein [Gongronella butleri]
MTSIAHHIHARFCRAMTVVHDMPTEEPGLQPIPSDKLKFYGLYKQATVGPCNTPKPSSRHLVDYAKWKAWYRLGQMDPVDAKNLYVNALVELFLEVPHIFFIFLCTRPAIFSRCTLHNIPLLRHGSCDARRCFVLVFSFFCLYLVHPSAR